MNKVNQSNIIFKNEIVFCVAKRLDLLSTSMGKDFINSIYGMNRVAEQAARDYVNDNYKSVSIVRGKDAVIHHAKSEGDFVVNGRGFYSIPAKEAAIILHTCKQTIRKMMGVGL